MNFKVLKTRHNAKSRLLGTKWACDPMEPFEIRDGVDHESRDKISMMDLYKLYWLSNHATKVAVKCEKEKLPEVEQWLNDRGIWFYQSRYETPLTVQEFHEELRIRAETHNGKLLTTKEQQMMRELDCAIRPMTMRFLYDFDTPTYYFFFWEPKEAVMFKLVWG